MRDFFCGCRPWCKKFLVRRASDRVGPSVRHVNNWRGTAFGGAKGRTDVPKIVDWYMEGKITIDPMITHVLSLDEINKGFDLMHAGESIRSVVVC